MKNSTLWTLLANQTRKVQILKQRNKVKICDLVISKLKTGQENSWMQTVNRNTNIQRKKG